MKREMNFHHNPSFSVNWEKTMTVLESTDSTTSSGASKKRVLGYTHVPHSGWLNIWHGPTVRVLYFRMALAPATSG